LFECHQKYSIIEKDEHKKMIGKEGEVIVYLALPDSLKGKLASIKTKCIIGTFHFL
jgi:hypothetical protein